MFYDLGLTIYNVQRRGPGYRVGGSESKVQGLGFRV